MEVKRRCIEIKGLEFVGFHGVYESEREKGNRFKLDVILEVVDMPGFESDEVRDTLNYECIIESLMNVCELERFHLLEALCRRLCEQCLWFREVERAQISVYKSLRILRGQPEWVGVSMEVIR